MYAQLRFNFEKGIYQIILKRYKNRFFTVSQSEIEDIYSKLVSTLIGNTSLKEENSFINKIFNNK